MQIFMARFMYRCTKTSSGLVDNNLLLELPDISFPTAGDILAMPLRISPTVGYKMSGSSS